MKIIKLENIRMSGFDRQTGEPMSDTTVEFICENCRHIVNEADKFCWQCGSPLETSTDVEHWNVGKKLDTNQFNQAKTLPPSQLKSFIDSIPVIPNPKGY